MAAGVLHVGFLEGARRERGRKVYSIDFPYSVLRTRNYIGVLVEDNMKEGWKFTLRGIGTIFPES